VDAVGGTISARGGKVRGKLSGRGLIAIFGRWTAKVRFEKKCLEQGVLKIKELYY